MSKEAFGLWAVAKETGRSEGEREGTVHEG